MKNGYNYGYYLVAFVDVLGQKEAFRDINAMPETEEASQNLLNAHKQTVGFVRRFRDRFRDFFDAYTKEKESEIKIPQEKKEQFNAMRKSILKYTSFSDCIQAYVPLRSEEYHSQCINGVFGVLGACGCMLLQSLSENKSFRAGLEVGIGTELESDELYGPAFFNAYTLESKIAKLPRIVIGEELINYLMHLKNKIQQVPNQKNEDLEVCKIMGENCLKMIVKDIDGQYILDYLGEQFSDNFKKNLSDDGQREYVEICKRAFNFVEQEYERRKQAKDEKLAIRYFMLYNYFQAKRKIWDLDF
jgi:hypothetical protein